MIISNIHDLFPVYISQIFFATKINTTETVQTKICSDKSYFFFFHMVIFQKHVIKINLVYIDLGYAILTGFTVNTCSYYYSFDNLSHNIIK